VLLKVAAVRKGGIVGLDLGLIGDLVEELVLIIHITETYKRYLRKQYEVRETNQ